MYSTQAACTVNVAWNAASSTPNRSNTNGISIGYDGIKKLGIIMPVDVLAPGDAVPSAHTELTIEAYTF